MCGSSSSLLSRESLSILRISFPCVDDQHNVDPVIVIVIVIVIVAVILAIIEGGDYRDIVLSAWDSVTSAYQSSSPSVDYEVVFC